MNHKLSHRGPDGEGYYSDQFVSLGHKRLAIIDLNNRSNQPFIDASSNFIIVFNGEIYNYLEIKKILVSEGGHPPRPETGYCCYTGGGTLYREVLIT